MLRRRRGGRLGGAGKGCLGHCNKKHERGEEESWVEAGKSEEWAKKLCQLDSS